MRVLRPLINYSALCIALGIGGGLLFGVVLSRNGGWLTPAPWVVYLLVLLAAVTGVSVLDARQAAAQRLDAWPLPPGYGSELVAVSAPAGTPEAQLDAAVPPAEVADAGDETTEFPAAEKATDEPMAFPLTEPVAEETVALPVQVGGPNGADEVREATAANGAILLLPRDGAENPGGGEVDGGT